MAAFALSLSDALTTLALVPATLPVGVTGAEASAAESVEVDVGVASQAQAGTEAVLKDLDVDVAGPAGEGAVPVALWSVKAPG